MLTCATPPSHRIFNIPVHTLSTCPPARRYGESYALDTPDDVAFVIGMTQIPYGVTLFFMQTFGYLHLSNRGVSEASCLLYGGLATATSWMLFYFATQQWHLHFLYTVNGGGLGLLFGTSPPITCMRTAC